MPLVIKSNFELSKSNEEFINKKCEKMLHELPDNLFVHFTIKKTELKFICQILYKDIIIFEENVDFHNCVCSACKKFLNQNRRLNRKYVDRRHKSNVTPSNDDDDNYDDDYDVLDDDN